MQVSILIAIPNFCLQSCALMMLYGPVIWTECAHKPPFYIPFGAEKVQSENKKTARQNFKTYDFQRGTVTSHDCFHHFDQSALRSQRVHKWARLNTD